MDVFILLFIYIFKFLLMKMYCFVTRKLEVINNTDLKKTQTHKCTFQVLVYY